jgi:O-antigen/teichoic acid export membrane protein
LKVIYKHQFDAKANFIEVACNLFLCLALIPHYGIVGAAIATAIPMIGVKAIILPVYVCRTVGIPLWNYYKAVGTPFILTFVLFAPAKLLPISAIASLTLLMAVGACYAVALAILLIMTLPRDDKITLAHAVGVYKIAKLPGGTALLKSLGV